VASAWIKTRATRDGGKRYRVEYRLGGRESKVSYGGSFRTLREATVRKNWITAELVALRVPDLTLTMAEPTSAPTVRETADRWLGSRIDVAANTSANHRAAVSSIVPLIGDRDIDTLTPADVAELVATLSKTRKRETVRKTLLALAMLLDYAGLDPNPARDKTAVRLPFEKKTEVKPPSAAHIEAVYRLMPPRYRLPLLVLDATGMRLGELEQLTWGDVDEPKGRWRVSQAVSKTRAARWVHVSPELFQAVTALVARDDRVPDRRVFQGFGGDRFRTAVTRACTAAGVPAFSPHDLRHRRISLLHRQGHTWADIGASVGQRSLRVTADTYTHVLVDDAELDYPDLLDENAQ
jgi:integrase